MSVASAANVSSVNAFDFETHKIQPGLLAPPIVCGSFYCPAMDPGMLVKKDAALSQVEFILTRPGLVAGANIAYDFGCAAAEDPSLLEAIFSKYERGEIWDVQVAQALDFIAKGYLQDGCIIDPATGKPLKAGGNGKMTNRFSLASCVYLRFGRMDAKANDRFRLSYALLEPLPIAEWPDDARQYPLDDAKNTYDVAWDQIYANPIENAQDQAPQAYTAWCEHLSSMWGLRTNRERVNKLGGELAKKLEGQLEEFKTVGFFRADGSKDTKLIKSRVLQAYGGNAPLTPGGDVSTARDVLAESGDPVLEKFADVSKTEKLIKTYLPFIESGVDKPINLRPNILLANGRSSYDGLIQLLPRKGGVRDCFQARQGHVLCSVDYSAIELSTLAQVCLWTLGFSKLGEALNSGLDPHSLLAGKMYATPYEEVLKLVEAGDSEWKNRRTLAKKGNFGYPGMMSAPRFVTQQRKEGLKLCEAAKRAEKCGVEKLYEWNHHALDQPVCKACTFVGEEIRIGYVSQWTEIKPYFAWITSHLEAQSDRLEQFVSGRIRGGLNGPSGANTLFSGLAADGAKAALRAVSQECYLDRSSPLFGSRVLVFAHDEIITEIPEHRAHDAAHRQSEVMVRAMKKYVPDVKVSAEPALMYYWYKDATPVYVNEKLVPWIPLNAAA